MLRRGDIIIILGNRGMRQEQERGYLWRFVSGVFHPSAPAGTRSSLLTVCPVLRRSRPHENEPQRIAGELLAVSAEDDGTLGREPG